MTPAEPQPPLPGTATASMLETAWHYRLDEVGPADLPMTAAHALAGGLDTPAGPVRTRRASPRRGHRRGPRTVRAGPRGTGHPAARPRCRPALPAAPACPPDPPQHRRRPRCARSRRLARDPRGDRRGTRPRSTAAVLFVLPGVHPARGPGGVDRRTASRRERPGLGAATRTRYLTPTGRAGVRSRRRPG